MCAGMASGRGEAIIRMQASKSCCEAVVDALESQLPTDPDLALASMIARSTEALGDETKRMLSRVARRSRHQAKEGRAHPVLSVPELGVVTVVARAGAAPIGGRLPADFMGILEHEAPERQQDSSTAPDSVVRNSPLWSGAVTLSNDRVILVSVTAIQTAPRFAIAVGTA